MSAELIEAPNDTAITMRLAKELAQSGFAVGFKGRPQDVLAVLLTGKELGIGPMAALRHISMIGDKPTLSAAMQLSLLRRDGNRVEVLEATATRAELIGTTPQGDRVQVSYTIEEATQAGLLKRGGAWAQYPADMLWARCVTRLVRRMDGGGTLAMYSPADFNERDVVEVEPSEIAPPEVDVQPVRPADLARPEDDVVGRDRRGEPHRQSDRLDSSLAVPEAREARLTAQIRDNQAQTNMAEGPIGEPIQVGDADLREVPEPDPQPEPDPHLYAPQGDSPGDRPGAAESAALPELSEADTAALRKRARFLKDTLDDPKDFSVARMKQVVEAEGPERLVYQLEGAHFLAHGTKCGHIEAAKEAAR